MIKKTSLWLLSAGLLASPIPFACLVPADAAQVVNMQDEAPADAVAGMLELARRRQTNVFLDSTGLDPATPLERLDPATRGPVGDIVNELVFRAQAYRLSTRRTGQNTFLVWPESDPQKIAEAVAKGAGWGHESGTPAMAQLAKGLRTYLVENPAAVTVTATAGTPKVEQPPLPGAKPRAKPIPVALAEFKLSQLPPELQQQLVASLCQLGPGYEPRDYAELWLSDETWQKASVSYKPAQPGVTGSLQSLLIQCILETANGSWLLILDADSGSCAASLIEPKNGEGDTAALQIWAPGERPAGTVPVRLRDNPSPPGTLLRSLLAAQSHTPQDQEKLATPISLDAVRQPLKNVVQEASKQAGIELALSPEAEAAATLVSLHTQAMPLGQFMDNLAQLCGLKWTTAANGGFRLESRGITPYELDLLRVGNLPWFRFREVNSRARRESRAEFEQFAAQLVDEAGPKVMAQPGIAVTSLLPETQAQLRERATRALARRILRQQIQVRDLLRGEWSFRLANFAGVQQGEGLNPGKSQLMLLIDGAVRRSIGLPNSPPETAQPEVAPQ